MGGTIRPADRVVQVWARYFFGEERMESLDILESRLVAEFDQAIAELEADGRDKAADRLRDARALVMASLDEHRAWMADPNREPRGGER
jgi:hypothetical protein